MYWLGRFKYFRRLVVEEPSVARKIREAKLAILRERQGLAPVEKEDDDTPEAESSDSNSTTASTSTVKKRGGRGRSGGKKRGGAPAAAKATSASSSASYSPSPLPEVVGDPDDVSDSEIDLDEIVHVKGWQGRRPGVTDTLPFLVPQLLWGLVLNIYWYVRWFVLFTVMKKEYGHEEKDYITAEILKVPWHRWVLLPDEQRKNLVSRELWEPLNMRSYLREMINSRKKGY